MPQTPTGGNLLGLKMQAVELTTLMQLTDPISKVFPCPLVVDS